MHGIIGVNSISTIVWQILKGLPDVGELFYIDDDPKKIGKKFNEILVRGDLNDLTNLVEDNQPINLSISLGEKYLRKKMQVYEQFKKKENVVFPVIKHESCLISELAQVDEANILSFGVIVGHGAKLKANSVFWSGAVIEHDCVIGEGCYIAPNVTISGFAKVGSCTLVGSGSTILPEVKIGANCIIGAGSVITRDIPDNSVVMGVPGKIKL